MKTDDTVASSLKFTEASVCGSVLVKDLAFILSVSDHNTLRDNEIYSTFSLFEEKYMVTSVKLMKLELVELKRRED